MRLPGPTVAAAPSDAHRFSRPSRALKVLLMEGIHENVETHATALSEDALIEVLASEYLSGAALDVFPSEPKAIDGTQRARIVAR